MRVACVLLLMTLGVAACGGSDRREARTPAAPPSARSSPATKAAADGDEKIIRGWADALRGGDVPAASRYFALPSVVSNGTSPIRLTSREDVEFFNRTLPCGARVTKLEDTGRLVVATLELTERPGPGRCGQGVGGTARTAFLITKGKIAQWRRVVDEEPGSSDAPSI
jgi:hypothetical protein